MAHVHGHHANHASSSRVLTWALGANGALLVVQVLGVLAFSSLALAADAVHQGSDVLALSVAVVALAVS
ncbi:MAG: cation transporter, partial [Acidimicrobiales bacterium]